MSAEHENGSPSVPAPDAEAVEHLNIKVTDNNNEVFFKIKKSTKLEKLMNAFCDRQGKAFNTIHLQHSKWPMATRLRCTRNKLVVVDAPPPWRKYELAVHSTGSVVVLKAWILLLGPKDVVFLRYSAKDQLDTGIKFWSLTICEPKAYPLQSASLAMRNKKNQCRTGNGIRYGIRQRKACNLD